SAQKSWSQVLGKGRQILEHLGAGWQVAFFPGLAAAAGEHEHRARPGGGGGGDVAVCVADHVGVLERDVEAPCDLQDHARLRLAAGAGLVRLVGTEKERVDAPAGLHRRALERVVDGGQGPGVEKAQRNPPLVGGADDAIAGLVQTSDRLEAALDRTPVFRRPDVRVAVVVDRAVAIEDDELHFASLERSAMRFIVPCSVPRKPMRLSRTRASLSITMTLSKNASTGAFRAASALSAPV